MGNVNSQVNFENFRTKGYTLHEEGKWGECHGLIDLAIHGGWFTYSEKTKSFTIIRVDGLVFDRVDSLRKKYDIPVVEVSALVDWIVKADGDWESVEEMLIERSKERGG